MNVEQYIASGVLEAYVLGDLPATERAEVERYAREYPEIRQELEAIEAALEAYTLEQAVAPGPAVLQSLRQQIGEAPPVAAVAPRRPWLVPALALALLASVVFGVWSFTRYREQERRSTSLEQNLEELRRQCAADTVRTSQIRNQLLVLQDPGTRAVPLPGTERAPDATAAVFFNPDRRAVLINPSGLPAPSANRQYQLWALVDGQPVSMGVLPLDAPADTLVEVSFVANAGAFAITEEPLGGSVNPSLETMVVMGSI